MKKLFYYVDNYFQVPLDNDFVEICENILSRVDDFEDETDIRQCIEDELIYDDDLWTIARHYASNPIDLNWWDVYDQFDDDIIRICSNIADDILEAQTEEEAELEEEEN